MDDFFEGQEKLLEVWFKPKDGHTHKGKHPHKDSKKGLRAIPEHTLTEILETAKCCILDSYHGNFMDSYVLSESSLFVTAHRIILKVGC